jgi:hypothetical protein
MTYQSSMELTQDPIFQGRVRACCTEQATTTLADAPGAAGELRDSILRGSGAEVLTFVAIIAAFPGLSHPPPDEDILSQVQANWTLVADLYFGAAA